MTQRRPLTMISGGVAELPTDDTLYGFPPFVHTETTVSINAVTENFVGNKGTRFNHASALTFTVPSGLTTANQPFLLIQMGAGQLSVVAGGGVTIHSAGGNLKLRGQYSAATLLPISSDVYLLIGDLVA